MGNENPIYEQNSGNVGVLPRTFAWMGMGLLETFVIAYITYMTGFIEAMPGMYMGMVVLELVVVILFNLLFRKLSPTAVSVLYFVYAAINGVTLASIFYVYNMSSIIWTILAAAGLFGAFAFLGKNAKVDLTRFGTLFMGVLIVGLVITVINLFIGSELINIVLDWALLIIFFGVTAWDIQKIQSLDYYGVEPSKLHIYGAMQLYLDFINIFIRLLQIFGKRRD